MGLESTTEKNAFSGAGDSIPDRIFRFWTDTSSPQGVRHNPLRPLLTSNATADST
jgi:hypothetical protein